MTDRTALAKQLREAADQLDCPERDDVIEECAQVAASSVGCEPVTDAIRALKAASSPADKVSDSHLKENSQANSTAPRSDGLHIHATEITGVMGLTRYERQVPCTKCNWGHDTGAECAN